MSGKLIVFEGVNGAGKTTQIHHCQQWLKSLGFSVLVTLEPGETPLGGEIRKLLLNPEQKVPDLVELLLYAADRADHVEKVIIPALEQGKIILCDRYTMSTIAYQGHGRGMKIEIIDYLNYLTTKGIEADITLWFDIDAEVALSRKGKDLDRLEQEDIAFHHRVQRGYRALAANPNTYTIDAILPEQEVYEQIKSIILKTFLKQTTSDCSKHEENHPRFDYSDLVEGKTYHIYNSQDDSLVASGKLLSVDPVGLKFEHFSLSSSEYNKLYITE